MRYIALTFVLLLSPGCGGHEGQEGNPDATSDAEEDGSVHDVLVPDGPCGPCDDSDPCTMDLCNTETLECVFLPLDMDFDGHLPTECDGDDCDDTRPDVYAGAREICLDGVDQDCDTLVDGPVVMRHDIQVTTSEDSVQSQDLAWTGSQFAIAWSRYLDRDTVGVYLSRLDGLGDPVGDDTTIRESTSTAPARLDDLSLVWSGESLATIWSVSGDLVFTRMSPTGEIEVPSFTTTSGGSPNMVWSGDGYGVILPGDDVSFAVLDPDGALTHGPSVMMEDVRGWGEEQLDVTWTGSGYGMVWPAWDGMSYLDIFLGNTSTTAVPDGEPVRLTDTGAWVRARLAWTGSEYGIVTSMPDIAVFFLRTDRSGAVIGGDTRLTSFSESNDYAEIVWTGSEFGIAWISGHIEGDHTIAFTLVDAVGDIRYPAIRVPTRGYGSSHSIVWTGSEVGVSWVAARNLDDCLSDPPGADCTSEVFFNRIGLCD